MAGRRQEPREVGGQRAECFWYTKAVKRALQGEAKLKYFQHAGALLTADGTDDELIKFEGVPAGYKLKVP